MRRVVRPADSQFSVIDYCQRHANHAVPTAVSSPLDSSKLASGNPPYLAENHAIDSTAGSDRSHRMY